MAATSVDLVDAVSVAVAWPEALVVTLVGEIVPALVDSVTVLLA